MTLCDAGTIPNSVCFLSSVTDFEINDGGSNPAITCSAACLSSVPIAGRAIPSTLCVYPQDAGLCAFIAATNIQSITAYSQWSCTTAGITSTNPCGSSVWQGVTCSGVNVLSIRMSGIGLIGNIVYICCPLHLFLCVNTVCFVAGTLPNIWSNLASLTYLDVGSNQLTGNRMMIMIAFYYFYILSNNV